MDARNQDIARQLEALRDAFAEKLPERLREIENSWESLCNNDWDREQAKVLHRLVHTMTGSAPTFGFIRLGQECRTAEALLKSWLKSKQAPESHQRAALSEMILNFSDAKDDATEIHATLAPTDSPGIDTRTVYVLEKDHSISGPLSHQLKQFDYETVTFDSGKSLLQLSKKSKPAAIIVDIDFTYDDITGGDTCIHINNENESSIPVIQISTNNDFSTRIQAVRSGSAAFFTKPFDPAQITDQLDKQTQKHEHAPYRVLVVDDDPALAAHIQLVLQRVGMDVFTVTDTHTIMDILADVRPEIILMDVYMPSCSGPEVAAMIRQMEAYVSTPIVYLSSEANIDKQFEAMRVGGDDFLTKPIDDNHLISSISIRAERSRLLNSLMIQDSLTGLLKHTKIKEQLAIEISRAHRSKTPLSFAMLDIDHFKNVNDTYGHITGDRVIKSLARLLQQRLRKSDSIGRYGGEEFAVVLPSCDIEFAENILNKIRDDFSKLTFTSDGQEFFVTISMGIATLESFHTPETINKAADEALYIAKNSGRNKVIVASPANISAQ